MFSRKPSGSGAGKSGPAELSFFARDVVIEGDVTSGAQIHVEGRIAGNVRCARLCQSEGGTIAGDILADEARIAGQVEGTVSAGTLMVEASARITGDVTYETISIAAGGRIDGRLARREALAAGEAASAVLIATPTEPEPEPVAPRAEAPGLFPALAGRKKATAA